MLKRSFQNLLKKLDQSVTEYLSALKYIDESLEAINSSITECDLVVQALTGLPVEYDPFITTYGNSSFYNFDDLCIKLLILEQHLTHRNNYASPDTQHAFIGATSNSLLAPQ